MATKIKLEVNHGKHAKQQSGQKITIPNDKITKQTKDIQQPKQNKGKDIKQKQQKVIQGNKKQQKKKQQTKNDKQKKQQPKKVDNSPKKKQQKSPQKQNKPDKQLQTLQRLKNVEQKTKLTIQQLLNQYKNAADDIFENHGHNQQKEQIIAKKLEQLKKEKQLRHKKLSLLQQSSVNRSIQKQKEHKDKQQSNNEKRKEKRIKKAQKKLQILKSLSRQRLQREQKYNDYLNNQYKSKVFRFQKYQKQYSQKQKQFQEQIKEKIAKNKKKYLPMDPVQIEDFVEQYESNKWNMLQQSQKKRQQYKQFIQQQNRRLKAKLWKGECHKRVQQQQKQRLKIKNQAKTKLQKTRQYGTIIKDQFKPKLDPKKRDYSLNLSTSLTNPFEQKTEVVDGIQYKVVARQKYQKGLNKGLIIQNLRKPLPHLDKVKKGNQYLQFIKGLPKVQKEPSQTIQPIIQQNPQKRQRKKTPSTTFKPKVLKNPYYDSSQTQRIISKSAALDQKRIKDPQLFHYIMADMRARSRQMELQQKAIKHGRYNGILQLQDKHNNLNRKMIQGISQKLSILSKM